MVDFDSLFQRIPALRSLLEGMPAQVKASCIERSTPAGFIVHQKDSLLETVGLLCAGTLKVINEFDTGDAYMIEYDHAIDFIGEVAVLAERERASVTIEAVSACTLLLMPRADFEDWLAHDPAFLRRVARHVARKLYNSSYHHGAELFYSPARLLLDFLNRYAQEHQPDAQGVLRVTETRRELSEQLGILPKTVDRTVRKLKDAELVSIEKGKLRIDAAQRAAIARRLAEWIE